MSVPFTQYLLPKGRQRKVEIELAPEVEEKAQKILAKGLRFECEMLSDYETVSFTITSDEKDEAIKLCRNGSNVPQTVTALIMEYEV